MKAVAREFVHPSGIRRIRIYARSDGAFSIAEEALYTNDYDPMIQRLPFPIARWLRSRLYRTSKTTNFHRGNPKSGD